MSIKNHVHVFQKLGPTSTLVSMPMRNRVNLCGTLCMFYGGVQNSTGCDVSVLLVMVERCLFGVDDFFFSISLIYRIC